MSPSDAQGLAGARPDGPLDMVEKMVRNRSTVDDWIAPLVEFDELRNQFGTMAKTVAGHRIDLQPSLNRHGASPKTVGT